MDQRKRVTGLSEQECRDLLAQDIPPLGMAYIDLQEFQRFGHLQEANRQYFHPRGMALTVVKHDDGRIELQVQKTDDPDGWEFGFSAMPPEDLADSREKFLRVAADFHERRPRRVALFGGAVESFPQDLDKPEDPIVP